MPQEIKPQSTLPTAPARKSRLVLLGSQPSHNPAWMESMAHKQKKMARNDGTGRETRITANWTNSARMRPIGADATMAIGS
ncbi:hypothetical protein CBM2592_A70172 [Cupriavidus taiwanensis]|nr:hypothetical protein CBM2592_A70172 [Cupriavidus taiwanensis]SOZ61624.1 hypothetical protein CBM2617_A40301 [Cupriavidus taiwanensis]SOZ81707.1 hypothetical protein CBM2618_A50303 [Cupriavidus taiwanensis]SOZ91350.1 hypothetical protein CBM2621_A50301 [Cupriavidus taiwanensis]